MTVVAPSGISLSSVLLTATAWSVLKRQLALPAYKNSWIARVFLYLWATLAFNSAAWGLGMNVFL